MHKGSVQYNTNTYLNANTFNIVTTILPKNLTSGGHFDIYGNMATISTRNKFLIKTDISFYTVVTYFRGDLYCFTLLLQTIFVVLLFF